MQMKAYSEVSYKKQTLSNKSFSDVNSIDTASILDSSNFSENEEEDEMKFSEAGEEEEIMNEEEQQDLK
jgi:hypothetical protein